MPCIAQPTDAHDEHTGSNRVVASQAECLDEYAKFLAADPLPEQLKKSCTQAPLPLKLTKSIKPEGVRASDNGAFTLTGDVINLKIFPEEYVMETKEPSALTMQPELHHFDGNTTKLLSSFPYLPAKPISQELVNTKTPLNYGTPSFYDAL